MKISQTLRAIGSAFAWGLLGSLDNYLNAGGIMESRQDFNQFHILNINEEIINAMGWNAKPGESIIMENSN